MKRKRNLFVFSIAMAFFLGFAIGETARGQIRLGPNGRRVPIAKAPDAKDAEEQQADDGNNVFLVPDRATLQLLNQAKELLEKERYGEAVRNLGAILESPEDFFFQPTKDRATHRSLKAEAQRMIGEMPKEGREIYEASYGDRARMMLNAAVAGGDAPAIAEVARRFFHTKAGYEATFLLGLHHLDHARPLAAALTLQRLKEISHLDERFEPTLSLALAASWQQAGMSEKAKEVLIDLKDWNPSRQLVIGGKMVPLFKDNGDALQWLTERIGSVIAQGSGELDRWAMFRGDPQRNAVSQGSAPLLNMRWETPADDEPAVEDSLEAYYRGKLDAGQPSIPTLHPLALEDVVLMRTCRNLLALDFATGKRLWEVPIEEAAENDANPASDLDIPFRVNAAQNSFSAQAVAAIARVWNDSLFGTLSSDGRLVFSIEDNWASNAGSNRAITMGIRRNPGETVAFNYLAARDIRSGKLKWALGGPNDQYALPLAETFFLGAPLPLMGQLYAIGETKGEIRLFVLDPDTEKKGDRVVWSQQLSVVDRGIQDESSRRIIGFAPSYADGILVCPTSTGATVAVDLATRSLLWGYRYPNENPGSGTQLNVINGRLSAYSGNAENSRWCDAGLGIAGGKVIVTPIRSEYLHCLGLGDGELKWKVPRKDGLYVACIADENVIVVDCKEIRAHRLADGSLAWNGASTPMPEGAMPSGRGFLSSETYYLPLSSAEVMAIDVKTGKIARISKSLKGEIPGNLVCYKGRILSQNYRGLEAFYQLDAATTEVAERLAANPRDAEAFCLQGEIRLDAGDRAQAVDAYRQAYRIADEPRMKLLLRDALLDGLRLEFDAYRSHGEEIESLLENSAERAAYLRLMIVGLQKDGEIEAAFERCRNLIDADGGGFPLDPVSKSLTVRRDRWIQARVAALRSEAKPELIAKIDGAIDARLKSAEEEGTPDALKKFLGLFGNQPVADKARAELIEKLKKGDSPLELELSLWQSQPVGTLGVDAAALAEAAEFFRRANSAEAAAASYRWLRSRFGDKICRGEKTGSQLVESIPQEDPLRKAVAQQVQWPTGRVVANVDQTRTSNNLNTYRIPIEIKGNAGPFFDGMTLFCNQNGALVCANSLGKVVWQLPQSESSGMRRQFFGSIREGIPARAWGHVLFMPLGGQLTAIDTLGADKSHPPKILWSEEAAEAHTELSNRQQGRALLNNGFQINAAGRVIMMNGQFSFDGDGSIDEPYFLANRNIVIQRARAIKAMNPLDGQTLWIRQDVPLGCTLFGDDEYVFALPPDKPEASVYRALDGELLGTRKIERRENARDAADQTAKSYEPLTSTCLAAFGRNLLYWRIDGDHRVLDLFDVWEQKSRWPARTFPLQTQCCLINKEVLGILEPKGKFTLVGLPDGRTLAETKLEPESNLTDVTVMPYEDTYLILTNAPFRLVSNPVNAMPIAGGMDKSIVSGRLYAIDRQGKLLWPKPAKIRNQYLVSGQAAGFPALVFASQIYEPSQPNKPGKPPHVSILMIDKRTGNVAFEKSDFFQSGQFQFQIAADPEKKTMQITLQRGAATLTFTDKPWPTKEELEKIQAEEKKNAPRKSLFKALKDAAEDAIKMPQLEFEE